jgi:hypothetical protein
MKRFLVFSGHYESEGGWLDFIGERDDLESARDLAKDVSLRLGRYWWHIVDTELMFIIESHPVLRRNRS